MGIGIKILKDRALIVGVVLGRLDADEAKATINRVAADPDFVWNLDRIIFLDDPDLSNFDLTGMFAVKDEIIEAYFGGRKPEPAELPAYRMAVVCRQPANAKLMKLFGTVWEADPTPLIQVQVFEAAADALAWLGHDAIPEAELRAGIEDTT